MTTSNRQVYELVLVGCTKQKRGQPAPARDLYDESPLFRRRRRIATEYATEWGILSAEHAYVETETVIDPYNTHISDVDRESLADDVWSDLEEIVDAGDRVCILAGGRDYVDPIRDRLHDAGAHVVCPLRSQMPGIQFNICDDLYDALSANAGTQQLCTDGGRQVALDGANLADSEIDGPVRSDPATKDLVKEAFGVVGTPRSVLIEEYDTLGEIEDASRVELVNLDGVGHATVDKIEDAGELYEEGDDGYLLTDGGVDRSEYVRERIPVSISHPSNRFWAATSISLFGWVATVRIRRKDERQTYRRWLKVEVFNYNYSDEAKRVSREKNDVLGREAFPNDGREECHSCGQSVSHGQEHSIQTDGGRNDRSVDTDTDRAGGEL